MTVGADPAIDQLLVLYDHPQGLAPEAAASWAAVRAGIVAGADETEAATLVASTLPDLIDDTASGELADRGVPAIAGLRTALACAQALRLPDADPGRLRAIASAASRAARRRDPGGGPDADGWLDEIEAKELLRAAGIAVPEGRVVASEDECGDRGGRAGWAGGAEAGDRPAAPQERGGRAAARSADGPTRRGPPIAGSRPCRRPPAGGCWWSEWRRPASSSWSRPAPTRSSRRWSIGLGGIWTEALDDVAIVPLPADAERVEQAILLAAGSRRACGRARPPGGRSPRRRRARRRDRVAVARVGARPARAQPGGRPCARAASRSMRSAAARRLAALVDLVVNRTIGGRLAAIEAPATTSPLPPPPPA